MSIAAEENKRIVLDFYNRAVNQHDIGTAIAHLGSRYVQHNPAIPDGIEGFAQFFRQLESDYPLVRGHIKRVVAEGDLVVLHAHAQRDPGEAGLAIVDIFRLEDGKIVEHWDVRQPVPERAVHDNGMF